MAPHVPDGSRHRVSHAPRAGAGASRARGVLVGVAAIASVVVAGCGGGDGEGSSTASARAATSTGSSTAAQATSSGAGAGNAEGLPPALGSSSAVRTAVEAVLASSDPARSCGKYVTERYLKVAYGGRGGCVQAQTPGSAATSLRSFGEVAFGPGGSVATVEVVPNGGPYDGSKVRATLRFDSNHYRVDRLHADVPVGP